MLNVHYKSLNKNLITENKMALKIRFLYEHIINTVFLESIKSSSKLKSGLNLQSRCNKKYLTSIKSHKYGMEEILKYIYTK